MNATMTGREVALLWVSLVAVAVAFWLCTGLPCLAAFAGPGNEAGAVLHAAFAIFVWSPLVVPLIACVWGMFEQSRRSARFGGETIE